MTCPASVPSQNPPKVVLLSGELFLQFYLQSVMVEKTAVLDDGGNQI